MVRRAAAVLLCAAAFTFTAAQFSWESTPSSGSNPESGSGEGPSFGSGDAAEPSFESYDIGPYKSDGGDDANKESGEKPPKEKKQKTARAKRHEPSFSAAFSGPQKSCPVCASVRLKGNTYVDYSDGRIHACSAACIPRVRRNPAAFAKILTDRGEQLSTP
jgi:hypothetical protein